MFREDICRLGLVTSENMSAEIGWRTMLSIFLTFVMFFGCDCNQQSSACAPIMTTGDLSRATVSAAGVFEGRLETVSGSSDQLNATFSFRRSHKGRFGRSDNVEPSLQIVVSFDVAGYTDCRLSDLLVLRQNYLVFVSRLERSANSEGQSGLVYSDSTMFPVPSTVDAMKQIRAYRCRNCGQIKSRLAPRSRTVGVGQTVSLTCRTSGKPVDEVLWFKDRHPLDVAKRASLLAVRKGSRLVLKNVTSEDSGTYECQARNAIAITPLSSSVIAVQPDVEPPEGHETLCANQDYCFNHGTCYILRSLGRKFCRCQSAYSGERCHEKRVPVINASERSMC